MEKAILIVETELTSPELAGEFHRQYNEIHLKEMLEIDGFVSARRYEPVGQPGPFIALYEVEADDIAAVQARLMDVIKAGKLTTPVGVRKDPPPTVRWLREIGAANP